jgi:6-phosphogluconate dehydrogenase
MSPSGDHSILSKILPQLEEWCAKDEKTGLPCVAALGPGGSGHYVKMVHNGIEQGMLGVLNEVWEMLFKCLHLPLDEISRIFGA